MRSETPSLPGCCQPISPVARPYRDASAPSSVQVAAARTFRVLPIVEGLYDMGNLAAVCRTSDGVCRPIVDLAYTAAGIVRRCCMVPVTGAESHSRAVQL